MDTQKAALFDMAPVRFDGKKLALLDQTKLPGDEIYIETVCRLSQVCRKGHGRF